MSDPIETTTIRVEGAAVGDVRLRQRAELAPGIAEVRPVRCVRRIGLCGALEERCRL